MHSHFDFFSSVPSLLFAGDQCVCSGVSVRGPAVALVHLHPAGAVQAASALHLPRAPTLLLHQRSQVPAAEEVGLTTPFSSPPVGGNVCLVWSDSNDLTKWRISI